VALVVERFVRGAGGVETVAYHLARGLLAREIDVTVVCRLLGTSTPRGAETQIVSAPRFWQPVRALAFSRAAGKATRSGFDIVHSLARTRHQDIYRAGGGSHAAYIEQTYRFARTRSLLSPRHRVLLSIEERVFRDPSQIIQCNARTSADEIARRFEVPAERLVTIYNGVDTERFNPGRRAASREKARMDLQLPGPAALFVGTGFHRKGLERAIRAIPSSAPRNTTLLVAGRGDPQRYRALAAKLGIETRVRFLGHRSDVPFLHAAADLFILPTRYDPFANACLEAMASGVPVATTRTNGAVELIEPGKSGFILEDPFEDALAGLHDLDRLARMGEAARATAEKYTWDRHVTEILGLYERRLT
jgi:UDP-glucose:(heptosyl)LPS alpha-1,3-glucosyltransferase